MNTQRISSPLASAIRIPSTWDELKLSKEETLKLEEFALQIRKKEKYGSGSLALFSGPSGTAKTLAASWLACMLDFPLYRVDLASITNKYIGETEKNFTGLLAQAERAEVILLFDEADALFGKRTDVQDRRDRNTERAVNDILQKLLKYRGIGILAATTEETAESALKERLGFILDFSSE